MSSSGAGYDISSSTYSPDGRIFQIEYATKAVENAGTALGLKCSDGVVLCVEKPLPNKMLLPTSSKRIHTVDKHSGIAITGFVSDGRQIVNRTREEALNFHETYGTKIAPHVLAERVGHYVHYFTLHGSLRPFGSAAIIASFDPETSEHGLYMVDPSGTAHSYFGCAAGKGRQPARTELEKINPAKVEVPCREGIKQCAKIIHLLHDDTKDKPFEMEMSWVCKESNWQHTVVPKDLITEAVEWAKKAIEEEEEEDDEDDGAGDMEE